MKKSVILLILIVYVASIMVVGFYGIKIKVYDEKIMVEDIICENLEEFNCVNCETTDIKEFKELYEKNGTNYCAMIDFSNEYAETGYSFVVKFAVLPRDATIQGIEFIYESREQTTSSNEGDSTTTQTKPAYTIEDNKDGTAKITIYDDESFSFQVRPLDRASNVSKIVEIYVY